MAEKTIMKLHPNGNLETLNTPLTQSGVVGNYSFGANAITVPQIVQLPPYRNYFIEKDSESGYISHTSSGLLIPPSEHDRTSDFINVDGWEVATIRIRYANMNGEYDSWVGICFYNIEYEFYSAIFEGGLGHSVGDYLFEHKISVPEDVKFIRIASSYYDNINANVQISVERGDTPNIGHAQAIEDISTWAKYTDSPISIFPEGIVIKGSLIQTST